MPIVLVLPESAWRDTVVAQTLKAFGARQSRLGKGHPTITMLVGQLFESRRARGARSVLDRDTVSNDEFAGLPVLKIADPLIPIV